MWPKIWKKKTSLASLCSDNCVCGLNFKLQVQDKTSMSHICQRNVAVGASAQITHYTAVLFKGIQFFILQMCVWSKCRQRLNFPLRCGKTLVKDWWWKWEIRKEGRFWSRVWEMGLKDEMQGWITIGRESGRKWKMRERVAETGRKRREEMNKKDASCTKETVFQFEWCWWRGRWHLKPFPPDKHPFSFIKMLPGKKVNSYFYYCTCLLWAKTLSTTMLHVL